MRPCPVMVLHSIIDLCVGVVNILVSWYKNSGTDPPGRSACTID